MKCPMCGKEYEGEKCPHCSGLDIIVNNADYLKRKEAYEKKQAEEKRSASSAHVTEGSEEKVEKNRDKAANEAEVAQDMLQRQVQKNLEQEVKNTSEYEEINYLNGIKKVHTFLKEHVFTKRKMNHEQQETDVSAAAQTRQEKPVSHFVKRDGFWKKYKKKIIVGLAGCCVLFAAVGGIYMLALRKNYVLYMSSNEKIYNVAGLESHYVCDTETAVFAADEQTFYKTDFPEEIDRAHVKEKMASDDGKYIAVSVYSAAVSKYQLYLFSSDLHTCKKISENTYDKHIYYVTGDGKVIYTDMEVLTDEGNVGTVWLNIASPDGMVNQVLQGLRSVGVYTGLHKLVCYGTDQRISLFDYEKMTMGKEISYEAKNIYLESDTDNFYKDLSSEDHVMPEANSLIFEEDGAWYYYNIADEKRVYFSAEKGKKPEFVFEDRQGVVYILVTDALWCGTKGSDGSYTFAKSDDLSGNEYVYLEKSNTLVYRTKDGALCSLNKAKKTTLTMDVTAHTLTLVNNSDSGITFYKSDGQYYMSQTTAKPVKMHDMTDIPQKLETYLYKNRLYFYGGDGQLYSCSKTGKDFEMVGEVDRIWLGTEYK